MLAKTPTKTYLTDLEIRERSIVLAPANRRKKLAQKTEENTMSTTMVEVVKSAIAERLKMEMSDKAKATLEAAMSAMEAVQGEMDQAAADKVLAALKEALAPVEAPAPAQAEATAEQKAEAEKAAVEKALATMPPAAAERFRRLEKAAEQEAAARRELEKTLAKREKAEKRRTWKAKTADLTGLPMNLDEAGELLADIAEVNEELAGRVEKALVASSAAVGASIGQERGTSARVDADSPAGKLAALAKARREKSGESMSYEQAFAIVLAENPELYTQYEAERLATEQPRR